MLLLAYPLLALLSAAFAGLTWLLAPLLAYLVGTDGNLPRALRWFQTFDATCDEGWKGGYFCAKGYVPKDAAELRGFRKQWLRRNPGYTLDYAVLGCEWNPAEWQVIVYENDGAGHVTFAAVGPRGRFNIYVQSGEWYSKVGWKAWNMYDEKKHRWIAGAWGPGLRIPLCFTPLMRRKEGV